MTNQDITRSNIISLIRDSGKSQKTFSYIYHHAPTDEYFKASYFDPMARTCTGIALGHVSRKEDFAEHIHQYLITKKNEENEK